MIKEANKTQKFNVKREAGQNPYSGIMSFQHFRGEKLYSDIVVKPENHMCETENVECYPVPDYVPENGRNEGYYPDSTVVYIRVLWKEFEPERGVYNYKFIEDIIEETKRHKQSLIFRLLPHSTRACDDVPDWLKELIDCPERPPFKRIKESPTDPLFVELFLEAIKKIAERFDTNPYFDAIDISLPGAWGEGSFLDRYDDSLILKIFDTYIDSFKHTQLISQFHRTELLKYAKEKTDIGWRADGLGDPYHTESWYPEYIPYISEFWKDAPVSFESYWWMCEWQRQGWDLDRIIEKTLEWHISSFNPKSIPIPMDWKEKVEYWLSKMGYHYAIDSFSYPEEAKSDDTLEFVLNIDNIGVAPCYHRIPLSFRLSGNKNYDFETDVDIKKWMPGKSKEDISICLPSDMESGEYDIEIAISSEVAGDVFFATDAENDGKYYKLGKIKIEK